jgi:hypothetical protein
MNLRELLQSQFWSKRTSRMLLAVSGLILGIFLAGLLSWRVVDASWITPGERNAARAALARLDAMQDSGWASDRDFSAEEQEAEAKIGAAEQAAWTARDRHIVAELMGYQSVLVVNRFRRKAFVRPGDAPLKGEAREENEQLESSGTEMERAARAALHEALD